MPESRIHHFVPQAYLKQFAKPASKFGKLQCFDLTRGQRFETKPRRVAARRDYNRVEIEGRRPDWIEGELSKFETELDRCLHRLVVAESIEDGDDFSMVLAFLALLMSNNPLFREARESAMLQTAKQIMNLTTSSEERWNSIVERARRDGVELGSDVPYEELRRAVRDERIVPVIERAALIEQEVKLWPEILPSLERRRWTLLLPDEGAGEFATADRPFSLLPPEGKKFGFYSYDVGTPGTLLFFPLSPRMAILGAFDDGGGAQRIDRRDVAKINGATFVSAMDQVYCRADFPIIEANGDVTAFANSEVWRAAGRDRP